MRHFAFGLLGFAGTLFIFYTIIMAHVGGFFVPKAGDLLGIAVIVSWVVAISAFGSSFIADLETRRCGK